MSVNLTIPNIQKEFGVLVMDIVIKTAKETFKKAGIDDQDTSLEKYVYEEMYNIEKIPINDELFFKMKSDISLMDYMEINDAVSSHTKTISEKAINNKLNIIAENTGSKKPEILKSWITDSGHDAHIKYNGRLFYAYVEIDKESPFFKKTYKEIHAENKSIKVDLNYSNFTENKSKWIVGFDNEFSIANKHLNTVTKLSSACESLSSNILQSKKINETKVENLTSSPDKTTKKKWVSKKEWLANKDKYKKAGNTEKEKYDKIIDNKLEELLNKLDSKETENILKDYLRFASKFHNYSFNNSLLLQIQAMQRKTNIEKVASFTTWAKMKNESGESVRINKGSSGIARYNTSKNKLLAKDMLMQQIKETTEYMEAKK